MKKQLTSMRSISFISDAIYPYHIGGKEVRLHQVSTGLVRRGQKVHIYTMKWWDGKEKQITREGVTLHAICKNYPLYKGKRRSIVQGLMFGLACFKLMFIPLDIIDVDHMPYFPLFSLHIIAKLRHKKLFATWHEFWGKDYWQEYLGKPGILAYYLELLTTRVSNTILAVSDLTANRLKHLARAKQQIQVINNGIDYSLISSVQPAKQTSDVIYCGRLLKHKNVDVLLQAVALLGSNNPNIRCQIIGDGPELANLMTLSAKLNLTKNVVFSGFLAENREVYAAMKASRVFVLPSSREGFGISVIEANACGLAVVTTSHPDNAASGLINQQNGRVCELSPEAIAVAIASLIDKPLTKAAVIRSSQRYSWDNIIDQLAKVYTS